MSTDTDTLQAKIACAQTARDDAARARDAAVAERDAAQGKVNELECDYSDSPKDALWLGFRCARRSLGEGDTMS